MAKTMESQIIYHPIGFFKSEIKKSKAQAARQGSEDQTQDQGYIELLPGKNFEQALEKLEGFSHLWILFDFHLSHSWKPKVQPPRFSKNKVGVFASRSPYRPNSIGLTASKIAGIKGRRIYLKGTDLIDGTPILDLKPYLSFSDSFPLAKLGWIGNPNTRRRTVRFSKNAEKKLSWLEKQGAEELRSTMIQHLASDPFNTHSKRVKKAAKGMGVLSLRKWRILFQENKKNILVLELGSHYGNSDASSAPEKAWEKPHEEDSLHQKFKIEFDPTSSIESFKVKMKRKQSRGAKKKARTKPDLPFRRNPKK